MGENMGLFSRGNKKDKLKKYYKINFSGLSYPLSADKEMLLYKKIDDGEITSEKEIDLFFEKEKPDSTDSLINDLFG